MDNINVNKQIMRDYKITRNEGEWYHAKVTDSYGNEYDNYFETAHQASEWIYHIWDNEEWFNSTNSQELLSNAIAELVKIDEKAGRRAIL
tara:strand:- start:111 stop:380 length:270 start_codon:yes stop_codon:yes gene_type:complete